MIRFTKMDNMAEVRFWKSFPQKGKETNLLECVRTIATMCLEHEYLGMNSICVQMPIEVSGGTLEGAIFNRDALYDWLMKHNYIAWKLNDTGLEILLS